MDTEAVVGSSAVGLPPARPQTRKHVSIDSTAATRVGNKTYSPIRYTHGYSRLSLCDGTLLWGMGRKGSNRKSDAISSHQFVTPAGDNAKKGENALFERPNSPNAPVHVLAEAVGDKQQAHEAFPVPVFAQDVFV